jgi:hypothetical protein
VARRPAHSAAGSIHQSFHKLTTTHRFLIQHSTIHIFPLNGVTLSPAEVTIMSQTPAQTTSVISTDASTYATGDDITRAKGIPLMITISVVNAFLAMLLMRTIL